MPDPQYFRSHLWVKGLIIWHITIKAYWEIIKKMLCWHKNFDPYPNVGCPQFCFKQKCVVCMGICMGKQPILFWGMGMDNPPKFNFFLHFPLTYPKRDPTMTRACASFQWSTFICVLQSLRFDLIQEWQGFFLYWLRLNFLQECYGFFFDLL